MAPLRRLHERSPDGVRESVANTAMVPPWVHRCCLPIAVTTLAVALTFASVRALAAAPAPHSARPGVAAAAEEEKKRVPKPKKAEPRYKPTPPGTPAKQEPKDDDSSDCASDCFSDCASSFFESLLFRSKSGTAPAFAPESAAQGEARSWVVDDRVWLRGMALLDSVVLWTDPGGAEYDAVVAGRLRKGAAVVVVGTHVTQSGRWLRVRPADGVDPVGWVAENAAVGTPPPTSSRPREPHRPGGWGVQVVAGGCAVGPADLNVEYSEGGFRGEAQYLRFMPKQWVSAAGFGVRGLAGQPRVNYLTPTTFDEPTGSRLLVFDLGVRAGQSYGNRFGFRFSWLAGPSLYSIGESANITMRDPVSQALLGTRVERLRRWSGGGELRLAFGKVINERFEAALQATGYMVGWEGGKQKSLTSDFVRHPIHGFDVALAVTISAP